MRCISPKNFAHRQSKFELNYSNELKAEFMKNKIEKTTQNEMLETCGL